MAEAKKDDKKKEEEKKETEEKESKTEKKEEKKEIELSKDAKKVMEMVEKMTVLELNDLVKALEDKFNVSASAPVMMGGMPGGNGNGGEEAEEKTSFDVELTSFGENKISVIKAIRTVDQALGLVDAKKLVESAPKIVLEDVSKENADKAKKTLEEAGAKVTLK